MKKLAFAGVLLIFCVACGHDIPELPAETQTGANTFGCLVNGELVVPFSCKRALFGSYGYSYDYYAWAQYDQWGDTLRIVAHGHNAQIFEFTVASPAVNRPAPIDKVAFNPTGYGENYYGGEKIGTITLTRFGQWVVSGTFGFVGRKYSAATGEIVDSDDSVTVSMGRFDIRMDYRY